MSWIIQALTRVKPDWAGRSFIVRIYDLAEAIMFQHLGKLVVVDTVLAGENDFSMVQYSVTAIAWGEYR